MQRQMCIRDRIKAGELGKTIFDFTLTFIGTICISPLLAYIAYRIKKEDPGPVIFKHMRVGKNGKSFPCYKFRSMCVDAKQMLEKYLRENPEARMEWERDFKLKNDPEMCIRDRSESDTNWRIFKKDQFR